MNDASSEPPAHPHRKPPRRHTRLAGLFVFLGSWLLLSPLATNWYFCYVIHVKWMGYLGIAMGLTAMFFPDWWDDHEDEQDKS